MLIHYPLKRLQRRSSNSEDGERIDISGPSESVLSVEIPMSFYDGTVPLIFDMPIFHPRSLQFHSLIRTPTPSDYVNTLNGVLKTSHSMIERLVPFVDSTPTYRAKRSVADFLTWCCGTAQQTDVDQLYAQETEVTHYVNSMRSQGQSDHDFIIQEPKVLNNYQFKVERFLSKEAKVIVER